MSRDELLALAERVEKATGPDREMDAAIATALGFAPAGAELRDGSLSWKKPAQTERGFNYWKWYVHRAATYTASLDAAKTLLDGLAYKAATVNWSPIGSGVAEVYLGNPGPMVGAEAATPALALTAAALRARASENQHD